MSGKYRELLGRLKDRRGSGVRRSDPVREAEQQKRQAEYRANQDRYRGDFEMVGGPGQMHRQVVTGYYNPETGANWSAPHSGYKPKEGTGWVKGFGPTKNEPRFTIPEVDMYKRLAEEKGSDRPIFSIKEKPPTASTSDKGKDFEALLRSRMSKF